MAKRFFKLIYLIALIAVGLSLPIYLLSAIQFDSVILTSYKAKCNSNNQYVVLQGSSEPYVFNEFELNDTTFSGTSVGDIRNTLNLYCKYYDAIQPHIAAYNASKTIAEIRNANTNFFNFREGVVSSVSSYPALYKLEVVSEEFQPSRIYNPIIDGLSIVLGAFVLLQILRMCYLYVVFGEVVWHPFRQSKKK